MSRYFAAVSIRRLCGDFAQAFGRDLLRVALAGFRGEPFAAGQALPPVYEGGPADSEKLRRLPLAMAVIPVGQGPLLELNIV